MILVDSSVWIAYLRAGDDAASEELDRLIEDGRDLRLTGLILTEVLQGIRRDADYRRARRHLGDFGRLDPDEEDYLLAADLYRNSRREGITVRSTIDCVIAGICLNRSIPLLHADRDFERLSIHSGLVTMGPYSRD